MLVLHKIMTLIPKSQCRHDTTNNQLNKYTKINYSFHMRHTKPFSSKIYNQTCVFKNATSEKVGCMYYRKECLGLYWLKFWYRAFSSEINSN